MSQAWAPYQAPPALRNAHAHTIYASALRRVPDAPAYAPELVDTPDGDLLELGWARVPGARAVAILSHGLEGHTRRPYMLGMARALNAQHIDALAWSYRGCGATLNRTLRLYHNGATDDLDVVVQHALSRGYASVFLIGFSMGGNLTMLYLGQQGRALDARVAGFVALSAPCDLRDSAAALSQGVGLIYAQHFLRTLRQKVRLKAAQFPGALELRGLSAITTFRQFDERYTAPLHGFKDAQDYWTRCSARPLIPEIAAPGLILSAADDPFLQGGAYPHAEVAANPNVRMEIPRHGGHVGFVSWDDDAYWSERRAVAFLGAQVRDAGRV